MSDHDPSGVHPELPHLPTGPLATGPLLTGPLLTGPQCWMVGRRNPDSLLQCNTYLRTFGSGGSAVNVCIDPGSRLDYPAIRANLGQLIGDVANLHAFSLNHQDPDVLGNAQFLMEANPQIRVMATEDVWRLAQHLLPRPHRVHFVNAAHAPAAVIRDRHAWQLVPTPFCHFRGAMAFYDPELRTLFSGDLFGGLNRLGRVQLLADEVDWAGIAQFHQIYMPGRAALRYAVRQIQALDPPVEVIAPQHGYVITGPLVPLFLERMHELLVGHDLLAVELDQTYLEGYQDVILQVMLRAAETLGREEVLDRLRNPHVPDRLHQLLHFEGDDLHLDREGYSAVVQVLARLARREPLGLLNTLRSEILGVCSERGLPIPPIGAGVEEASSFESAEVAPDL